MTPEEKREKRKSRQQEIERSALPPTNMKIGGGVGGSGRGENEDEQPVMSATSFPGQMWQPDYSHWDGD